MLTPPGSAQTNLCAGNYRAAAMPRKAEYGSDTVISDRHG